MSDIHFCITPIGDLPHYYYIFSNMDTSGVEVKNVTCFMLGDMLHLDIQKGKEAMSTSKIQQQIGGNVSCMKRLMMAKKGVAN